MNVLFLTLVGSDNINERGIYNDLMRKLRDERHNVCIVSPSERREKKSTRIIEQGGISLLKVKTLNIQKTNIIEKALSTLLIEYLFLSAIKKHFTTIKFDLVLYSTPPITFSKVIKYIKNRDGAKSYLLLKDIFPQNAVDIGLIKKDSFIHRYFRKKEVQLYSLSDYIGCMSPANVKYILKDNYRVNPNKVEVNPNSITPIDIKISETQIQTIRAKYKIPIDTVLFAYGGNLGLPQGIDFLIEVLNSQKNNNDIFFVIIGSGTMYPKLKRWIITNKPENARLHPAMPKVEYDEFVKCVDVGMIFLDNRFTIPNFPSRLLSYLEMRKPVMLATDTNTDVGKIAMENNFGFWSESGDIKTFTEKINLLKKDRLLRKKLGENGYNFLINNYTTEHSYSIIMKHFENVH